MKKLIVIVCVVALLIAMGAVAANAAAGNWIVTTRAYSSSWTGADKVTDFGVKGAVAVNTVGSGSPAASKVWAVGSDGTAWWTTQTVPTGTAAKEWAMKVGQGSAAFTSLYINVYNQASNLGAERALDTGLVYKLKNGETTVATFSTLANYNGGMVNWFNVSVLMKGANWANSSTDRGWYYIDNTPTTSSTVGGLEDYSFSFEQPTITPEPGSMLALGSGLIGMFGFVIRRRRA